jgi:hypothetical protein
VAVRDFRALLIWQRAMELARRIHEVPAQFPAAEQAAS